MARPGRADAAPLARPRREHLLRDVLLRLGDALLPRAGAELRLLRPRLIVTVGGLAARRLLGVRSVSECVGVRYEHGDAVAIPLPHPSGASSWPNLPANRKRLDLALELVHEELDRISGRPTTDATRPGRP